MSRAGQQVPKLRGAFDSLARGAVLLVAGGATGAAAVFAPEFAVAGAISLIALPLLWLLATRVSIPLAIALPVLAVGLFAPRPVVLLTELMLVVYLAGRTMGAAMSGDRRWVIGALCLLLPAVWMAGYLNPNEPDIGTALAGTRKATLAFVALGVGALWPDRGRPAGTPIVVGVLVFGAAASLAIHLGAPSVESGFTRSADTYTSLFRGSERMQGLWAGPFHVALAGSFLLVYAGHLWLSGRVRAAAAGGLALLGAALVVEANVRTAWLAIGFALLIIPALGSQTRGTRVRQVVLIFGLFVALVALVFGGYAQNDAVDSLSGLGSDGRALERLDRWDLAIQMFSDSPFYGNGPGSAGATLQDQFVTGRHVTTDNAILVPLVEGGVIGVLIFAAIGIVLASRSRGTWVIGSPAAALVPVVMVFALTNNVLEASPVSLLLMMLLGMQVWRKDAGVQP